MRGAAPYVFHQLSRGSRLRLLSCIICHLAANCSAWYLTLRARSRPSENLTFCDHMDLAHDLSVGRVHCFAVHIFAVTRELSSADEILYLMLQIKAHRIRVTGSVMEQAKLVLMLLRDLHFIGNGGRKSTSLRELTKISSIEAVSSWYVTYRCLGARAASFPGCASRCFLSSRG